MASNFKKRSIYALAALSLASAFVSTLAAPEAEPIAYVGHGALFDSNGRQITLTPAVVKNAQRWYLDKILSTTTNERREAYENTRQKLKKGLSLSLSEDLLAEQAALVWLSELSPRSTISPETVGKLRALNYRLSLTQNPKSNFLYLHSHAASRPTLLQRMSELGSPRNEKLEQATTKSGKAYVDECAAAQVPIPPPIGKLDPTGRAGWKSEGFLEPQAQFIVGTPAEIRTYTSDTGVCYALPRYVDDSKSSVALDGVICLSKITSKTCFWDNQMQTKGFEFSPNTLIPIGYPDLSINAAGLYQAGGGELEGGSGGVCTSCHRGENPYIVHPKAQLATGVLWGSVQDQLPAFGTDRYEPIVPASWPQNPTLLDDNLVPKGCVSCHSKDGSGGRFPALSAKTREFCDTILKQAVDKTMPPKNPGSMANQADVIAFLSSCQK